MPDDTDGAGEFAAYQVIALMLLADYIHRQRSPEETAAAMKSALNRYVKELGAELPAKFVDEVQMHLQVIVEGAYAMQAQWPDSEQKPS